MTEQTANIHDIKRRCLTSTVLRFSNSLHTLFSTELPFVMRFIQSLRNLLLIYFIQLA